MGNPLPRLGRRSWMLSALLLAACGPSPQAQRPGGASGGEGYADQNAGAGKRPQPYQPASAEVEERMRQQPIKFYMAHWCPVCRRARAWLQEGGYTVEELNVEEDERAATYMMMVNPRGSIPMFEIDGIRVIGFAPDMVRGLLRRAVERRMRGERLD